VTAAVMEKPPADDPESDVRRADAVVQMINQRLAEAELAVVEARDELTGLALLAEIDTAMAKKRDLVRKRLREAETRLGELQSAQVAAADLGREARARALLAHREADWQAASVALDEAGTTAAALDGVLHQVGDLYRRLKMDLGQVAGRISQHLSRHEYNIPVPAELDDVLRLIVANAGGPAFDPFSLPHLEGTRRSEASLASLIERHAGMVLRHRPATTTEEESANV
jgi:hypothetical protein